ncbi:MAG TPA: class I SAM-dependent methyltransferase [Solirubrobacteraceae bacterium]|jgi:2-polyprenyl-3-methyl-5-hydroxy-6-metoxy-1,4-benzoquinol methylase|nr:class I SAM-dependent methyltransferase [Solirubrobacteraceae bacterium]
MPATIPLDAPKSDGYYALGREEVIAYLPRPVGRVLDVGCGEGGAAGPLRAAGASYVAGIEILPEPAARAEQVYDEVRCGDAIEQLAYVRGPFDSILCYDVLEHLYDPAALVRALVEVAAPGARLHVSVPNASHVSLLRDLIVRGTFGYKPFGHRDATHLRWFTRKDISAMLEESGWCVLRTDPSKLWRTSRTLDRLTHKRSTEFFAGQWFVLAQKAI